MGSSGVMEYQLVHTLEFPDSLGLGFIVKRVLLYACTGCGALVSDQEVHDAWHKNQRRVADDASWGAMVGRPIG